MLYAALYTISDFRYLNVGKLLEKLNEDPMIASPDGNMLSRNMPFFQRHLELHSLGRVEPKKGIENVFAYAKTFKPVNSTQFIANASGDPLSSSRSHSMM